MAQPKQSHGSGRTTVLRSGTRVRAGTTKNGTGYTAIKTKHSNGPTIVAKPKSGGVVESYTDLTGTRKRDYDAPAGRTGYQASGNNTRARSQSKNLTRTGTTKTGTKYRVETAGNNTRIDAVTPKGKAITQVGLKDFPAKKRRDERRDGGKVARTSIGANSKQRNTNQSTHTTESWIPNDSNWRTKEGLVRTRDGHSAPKRTKKG
jgi:hypothetical protein